MNGEKIQPVIDQLRLRLADLERERDAWRDMLTYELIQSETVSKAVRRVCIQRIQAAEKVLEELGIEPESVWDAAKAECEQIARGLQ